MNKRKFAPVIFIETPTVIEVLRQINTIEKRPKQGYLILVGQQSNLDIDELIRLLNNNKIMFCGAIFPAIIYDSKKYPGKVLIVPMEFEETPILVRGLDNGNINIQNIAPTLQAGTLLVLVDGLSNWISKFLFKLYEQIGTRLSIFGTGAGLDSFGHTKNVFNSEGFFKNVAILIPLKNKISQSIKHGWKSIAGPYLATKTKANLVEEINWEPAFEVYKKIIQEAEQKEITKQNYYEIAKHHPFGIYRTNAENLIRDPVAIEPSGALRFVAEIPLNTVLYLMKSNLDSMLEAGTKVCQDAFKNSVDPTSVFVVDCVSRTKILLDKFNFELNAISKFANQYNVPVFGILSIGEISSANQGMLEYHNKTLVIGVIEENE